MMKPAAASSNGAIKPSTQQDEWRRVNVKFAPSTYQALESLAQSAGSISAALRDAIALAKWFQDVTQHDGHILVERDGQVREIIRI